MKKIFFITAAATCLFLCACAQKNSPVKSAAAFYKATIPGMNRKDDNGNVVNPPPIITRVIYIEVRQKPVVETVLYNGIPFTATVTAADSAAVNVGIDNTNGGPVILKPSKHNSIWQVDLVKKNEKDVAPENVSFIIIKGRVGKQAFSYKLKKETELAAPVMY